ncbi:Conserved_hypothetical protein [Hexamita inflata]|uniref:Uncharacterized protein n=2 Tax=Hexamita inflata TaxID=28002 RepID=A0AA86QJL4_9EUKA|nr:Conserved hypothetical protein [Hexamita inflata]
MQLLSLILTADSQTFIECFSSTSYITGNTQLFQLTLHLQPFPDIDMITSNNMCKTQLPGLQVEATLKFPLISFPILNDPVVSFTYVFNQPQKLIFQLSEPNYNSIINEQHAMYELVFDKRVLNYDGAISSISHTKLNGTNCYSSIKLQYTGTDRFDVLAEPLNCNPPMTDAQTSVYLAYIDSGVLKQFKLPKCITGCLADEYSSSLSDFQLIKKYTVDRSEVLPAEIAIFNAYFAALSSNRLVQTQLIIYYLQNAIQTQIIQDITWKVSADPLLCSSHGHIMVQMNANEVAFQMEHTCAVQAENIFIEIVLFSSSHSYQTTKQLPLESFWGGEGTTFEVGGNYSKLREETAQFMINMKYMNNTVILYEHTFTGQAVRGCIKSSRIHSYVDKMCLQLQSELGQCSTRVHLKENQFHVMIHTGDSSDVAGEFHIQQEIDYKNEYTEICMACDIFVGDKCKETLKSFYKNIQKGKSGYIIDSEYEYYYGTQLVKEGYNSQLSASFGVFAVVVVAVAVFLVITVKM